MRKTNIIISLLITVTMLTAALIIPATPQASAASGVTVEELTPPSFKYSWVNPHKDGLAKVKMSSAYVDHPQYIFATSENLEGLVDRTGNVVVPIWHSYLHYPIASSEDYLIIEDFTRVAKTLSLYNILDKSGKVVKELQIEYTHIDAFRDGMARVQRGSYYGFIDVTGTEVVPLIYTTARDFHSGLALVTTVEGVEGFIDKSGKWVFTYKCEMHSYSCNCYFSDGLMQFKRDEKYGFYNKTGAVAIPAIYESASHFMEGTAKVKVNGKMGIIGVDGSIIVPIKYDAILDFGSEALFREGMAAVRLDNKWGFVDKTGKVVITPKYDEVGEFKEGMAVVGKGDKKGVIDKTGKEIVAPDYYSTIYKFSEGLAVVIRDGKAGYIDKTGAVVIPLQYGVPGSFKNGLALVKTINGTPSFLIDKTGAVIVPPDKYDEIREFSEGLAWVKKGGLWGILAVTGSGGTTTAPPTQPATPPPVTFTVQATPSTVFVNGTETRFEAYIIGGNNYFKLRDLALAVSGTEKQFDVGWDAETKAITLMGGMPYTIIGGEMQPGDGIPKRAALNKDIIISLDGKIVEITAYLIGGNNFVKLRDVMKLFDVGVTWDAGTRSIGIDTSIKYME